MSGPFDQAPRPALAGSERRLDRFARRLLDRIPRRGFAGALAEFIAFGVKQAWACLFGGAMLALLLGTHLWWPAGMPLARYDALFLAALSIQALLVVARLETLREAKVILIFHLVGTVMELFKTAAGSWAYPEPSLFRIGGVPLFSGFMYAAVGSYLARVTRLFDLRYTRYPPSWMTVALAVAIYVNFFTHHFAPDVRPALFAATAVLFLRTRVEFRVFRQTLAMPLLLGFILVALFIWLAENVGTWSNAWVYPSQSAGWHIVPPAKLGAWLLLMIVSFVLVTLVHRPKAPVS